MTDPTRHHRHDKGPKVQCWKHGVAPAYGPKDDRKCLRCAQEAKQARDARRNG